jgi:uncharacterized protein (DUF1778 family)
MFTNDIVKPTQGKMAIRKQVGFHLMDAKRIQAAAEACGLREAEFIRQAALLHAQQIERRMSLSILPIDAFEAFRAATAAPGQKIPGLACVAARSRT